MRLSPDVPGLQEGETTWRTPRARQPPSSDFATWGSCKTPYTRSWFFGQVFFRVPGNSRERRVSRITMCSQEPVLAPARALIGTAFLDIRFSYGVWPW